MGTKYQPLDAIIIILNSSSGKSLLIADENWFDFDWRKILNNKKVVFAWQIITPDPFCGV